MYKVRVWDTSDASKPLKGAFAIQLSIYEFPYSICLYRIRGININGEISSGKLCFCMYACVRICIAKMVTCIFVQNQQFAFFNLCF